MVNKKYFDLKLISHIVLRTFQTSLKNQKQQENSKINNKVLILVRLTLVLFINTISYLIPTMTKNIVSFIPS